MSENPKDMFSLCCYSKHYKKKCGKVISNGLIKHAKEDYEYLMKNISENGSSSQKGKDLEKEYIYTGIWTYLVVNMPPLTIENNYDTKITGDLYILSFAILRNMVSIAKIESMRYETPEKVRRFVDLGNFKTLEDVHVKKMDPEILNFLSREYTQNILNNTNRIINLLCSKKEKSKQTKENIRLQISPIHL